MAENSWRIVTLDLSVPDVKRARVLFTAADGRTWDKWISWSRSVTDQDIRVACAARLRELVAEPASAPPIDPTYGLVGETGGIQP
jgi:hypothetical protein